MMFAFTFPDFYGKFTNSVLLLNELSGEAQQIEDMRLDFKDTKTVLVRKNLYAFKEGFPVYSSKYADFTCIQQLKRTALSTLPRVQHL